jgi:rhodanese-related sulfurtransferase
VPPEFEDTDSALDFQWPNGAGGMRAWRAAKLPEVKR